MKHVHDLITNNIQPLGYHPSGTYYRYLKNMDFVPYVRISKLYYYIWILSSNVNVADPKKFSEQRDLSKINASFVKVSIFKSYIMAKNTA